MEVHVDRTVCEANGVCVGLLPEVFELDDDDELHVAPEPPDALEEQIRYAVRACPKAALTVTD